MFGLCKECGNKLDMYYGLWCPSCTKPENLIDNIVNVNLIQMLNWCERRREGIKERVWSRLCDDCLIQNDTMIRFNINENFSEWIQSETNIELIEDLKFILNHFQKFNITVFDISW